MTPPPAPRLMPLQPPPLHDNEVDMEDFTLWSSSLNSGDSSIMSLPDPSPQQMATSMSYGVSTLNQSSNPSLQTQSSIYRSQYGSDLDTNPIREFFGLRSIILEEVRMRLVTPN